MWQRLYKWYKYKIYWEIIGYFNDYISDWELKERYPEYTEFKKESTGYGTTKVYGKTNKKGDFIRVVESTDRNKYPDNNVYYDYWYEFIE